MIWRDPKLQGNDYFSDKLVGTLPKAAVLVSIVSPRYVKSERPSASYKDPDG